MSNFCVLAGGSVADDDIPEPESQMAKEAAEALSPTRRQEDLALYHAYAKSPSPGTFQPLYRAFKNFIFTAAQPNMRRSTIPQAAHTMRAAQSFHDALRTFQPGKRSLHSHVFDTVREKGKRLNYKYQNIGYIPEARAAKYQLFQNTEHMLTEMLSRPPSAVELADELHWSVKMVETLRRESRRDLVLNEAHMENQAVNTARAVPQEIQDVYYNIIPQHQLVLEHLFPLSGKPLP